MATKKTKAKKAKAPKKRTPAKRKKAKSIAEQIDAFDWRDVKKMFIGGGIIGGETLKRPKK
jgi:hypothetical protein